MPKHGNNIEEMGTGSILSALKGDEPINYIPDISRTSRKDAQKAFDYVLGQEDLLSNSLSRGIREQKGFKGSTRIPDIVKELSLDMGIDPPDLEFKYMSGLAGTANIRKNLLTLNPQFLRNVGDEALIAHELRHFKDSKVGQPFKSDNSIRNILYTRPDNPLIEMLNELRRPEAHKKLDGKSLNFFNKKEGRLFANDALKHKLDALDIYSFLEKGHFKSDFLVTNLKRVAKGLPIIGTAIAFLTNLDDATAAIPGLDMAEPMGYDKSFEPGNIEYQQRMNRLNLENAKSKKDSNNSKLVKALELLQE